MSDRGTFELIERYEQHKGFYNDEDPEQSLSGIEYTDFWEFPDDDDFPYFSAYQLLRGSCNHFALSLQKLLGYSAYVIESNNDKRGFHVFCQIYKNKKWYYVDARGITSSFNEFLYPIRGFVNDEYVIRPVSTDDVENWDSFGEYNKEAYAFSEAVIAEYIECYTMEE